LGKKFIGSKLKRLRRGPKTRKWKWLR